ncbi:uncharacterized protein A4U43_C09F13740 [Asparagus officinalis]|uniref:Uncharacterized protein n=1 Tax=Asparagus officinalis TaxID=4686 RepID=A0A5P1E982_ASPOF|nr:uncharacterized protein A4U43_C09F13740 [Asparagus officinalis]
MPHPLDFPAELEHPNAEPAFGQLIGPAQRAGQFQPGTPLAPWTSSSAGLGDFGPPDKWKEQQSVAGRRPFPIRAASTGRGARRQGAGSQMPPALSMGASLISATAESTTGGIKSVRPIRRLP